jgi:hypothetical protein
MADGLAFAVHVWSADKNAFEFTIIIGDFTHTGKSTGSLAICRMFIPTLVSKFALTS